MIYWKLDLCAAYMGWKWNIFPKLDIKKELMYHKSWQWLVDLTEFS